MNLRRLCLLLALCGAGLFSACSFFEPGNPGAATTVRARSAFQVSDVLERVFVDEGYQAVQRARDSMTFERPGSKTDRVLYGNWLGGDMAQRIKVTIVSRGDETYRLRAAPSVVRDPHDLGFEDSHRRFEFHSYR